MIEQHKCPNCGSQNIKQADNLIYPTNPPQIKLRCFDCGTDFMSGITNNKDTQSTSVNTQPAQTLNPNQGVASTVGQNIYPNMTNVPKYIAESSTYAPGPQGWICPKCGNVLSPNQSYCIFCYTAGTTINI